MTPEALRLVEGFLRAAPVPMLAVDRSARLMAANDAAKTLIGNDILDRPFVTVLRHAALNQAIEAVIDPGAGPAPAPDLALPQPPFGMALRAALGIDGRDMAADVTVAPLPAGLGRGAIITIIDSAAQEQAEQMRSDFVANVSHELRTPLTAMMGFIETLRGPARDDAAVRERFLGIMDREANRMNRLVSDLLSLSRVEAEERRRPDAMVDLVALLSGVVATMAPRAAAEGVAIAPFSPKAEIWLPGDHDQLVQVFQNLIENAVKYGGAGGEVQVRLRDISHEPVLRGPAWAVDVIDHGEGIAERHLPRLTERFYRVDNHRSREQGGTGLGLAIVKHIVNRHRGRLRVESTRGQGSKFTVILPVRPVRR